MTTFHPLPDNCRICDTPLSIHERCVTSLGQDFYRCPWVPYHPHDAAIGIIAPVIDEFWQRGTKPTKRTELRWVATSLHPAHTHA
jgi:hypothetical protein